MKQKLKLCLILLLCLFHFTNATGHSYKKRSHIKKRVHVVYVGSTRVSLIQYKKGSGKHFIHVHESETTAKRAALAYIKQHGGSLLSLKHSGDRNITFILRHQRYEFDPNRIFTPAGIKASLRLNSHYSPAAAIEVKKLARALLRLIPRGKVIAVHNNKDYSMLSYLKGHELSRDVRAVHRSKGHDHRNFYLVTRYNTYRRLKRLGFNVVWQARRAQNDGSLSIYLARRDYVNVEAAYDAFNKQLRMLRYA
jgi:hypothetical protein